MKNKNKNRFICSSISILRFVKDYCRKITRRQQQDDYRSRSISYFAISGTFNDPNTGCHNVYCSIVVVSCTYVGIPPTATTTTTTIGSHNVYESYCARGYNIIFYITIVKPRDGFISYLCISCLFVCFSTIKPIKTRTQEMSCPRRD